MTTQLNLQQNMDDYDDYYELLVDAHQDLSEAQSAMLNAQAILLLSNHIGELNVLKQAFALARKNVDEHPPR